MCGKIGRGIPARSPRRADHRYALETPSLTSEVAQVLLLSAPILLGLTLHTGAYGFFILSQSGERPEREMEILALRDDAFETKLAGIGEDGRAFALHMLVEPDAGAGLGHDIRERGLADLKRIAPQIVAVQVACFVMPVPCRSRSPFHCGNRRRIRRPPHATNPCSAA